MHLPILMLIAIGWSVATLGILLIAA